MQQYQFRSIDHDLDEKMYTDAIYIDSIQN